MAASLERCRRSESAPSLAVLDCISVPLGVSELRLGGDSLLEVRPGEGLLDPQCDENPLELAVIAAVGRAITSVAHGRRICRSDQGASE